MAKKREELMGLKEVDRSLFKNLVRGMEKIVGFIILIFFLLGFLIGVLFTAVWRKVLPYIKC